MTTPSEAPQDRASAAANGRTPDDAVSLGNQIRTFRKRADLTLQALADTVGVTPSLISQVERGVASPSVTTLRLIASALDVPVAALFVDAPVSADGDADRTGRRLVVRRGGRKSLRLPQSRVVFELLTPDLNRQVEFIWIEYEPGDMTHPEPMAHPGEENAIVLEGSVTVTIEGEAFHLNAGDSISFDSGRLHQVENRSSERAILISAITPPAF
jgi:transcriptional regulator with XRE-family HTH domain